MPLSPAASPPEIQETPISPSISPPRSLPIPPSPPAPAPIPASPPLPALISPEIPPELPPPNFPANSPSPLPTQNPIPVTLPPPETSPAITPATFPANPIRIAPITSPPRSTTPNSPIPRPAKALLLSPPTPKPPRSKSPEQKTHLPMPSPENPTGPKFLSAPPPATLPAFFPPAGDPPAPEEPALVAAAASPAFSGSDIGATIGDRTALSSRRSHSHGSVGIVVGCVIGGVVLIAVLGVVYLFCRGRKNRKRSDGDDKPWLGKKETSYAVPYPEAHMVTFQPKPQHSSVSQPQLPNPPQNLSFTSGTFTYDELELATGGFSQANLLGEGGFGFVHRGVLSSGREVAVKKLKTRSKQGEREFRAEVETFSQVHHKHLVTLVGYCITGSERLLVYEFVPNKTLEFHLHGKEQHRMEWPTRLKIAIGSAKGIAYLHEDCNPTIIHRDIKAANILLDFKFDAKVSDFGLAKFFSDKSKSSCITHISTRVVGTFGYLAPEYASSGKVTEKSDIYSFGVMLLELITGCPPICRTQDPTMSEGLVGWARPLLTRAMEDGDYTALADPNLGGNYNPGEMASMVACAAACVRHSAWLRPRMSQIVRTLEGDVSPADLNEGTTIPGHSTIYGASETSSTYDAYQYKEDLKQYNMALVSLEHGIGRFSGSTSECSLNQSGSGSSCEMQRST